MHEPNSDDVFWNIHRHEVPSTLLVSAKGMCQPFCVVCTKAFGVLLGRERFVHTTSKTKVSLGDATLCAVPPTTADSQN